MRIPYRWLREFVDTGAEPRAVAERLTMAGIETGLVAEGASELGGLVVAEVLDAALPGGRRVDVATIRGIASEGMLCSEAELGVGPDASGILLLGADAPVGADLVGNLLRRDVFLDGRD